MFNKLKEFSKKGIEKARYMGTMAMCSSSIFLMTTLADTNKDGSTDIFFKDLLNQVVFKIFRYVGIMLFIYGAFQLFMSFRNDDSDSKVRSTGALIAGLLAALTPNIITDLMKTAFDLKL